MELKRPAPTEQGLIAQHKEESTGLGYGFSIGGLYNLTDKLSLGANFKSEYTIAFEGTAENNLLAVAGAAESDFERDITWPMSFTAGLGYKATDKLTLAADMNWLQWSANQDVILTSFKNATWDYMLGNAELGLHWEDQIQIRLGGQYQVNDMLALRAGYYHDPAPAPDKTANILFPSITNNAITIGAGVKKGLLAIDFSLEVLVGTERDIKPQTAENNLGLHNMNILVPNFSLSYFLN